MTTMGDSRSRSTFRQVSLPLVEGAQRILAEQEGAITLRHLFYLCVSAGLIENSHREYRRLGEIMTTLRRAGTVPFHAIVDNVRQTLKPSSWSGLADFAETVRDAYRKNLWARQDEHVEFFSEKDSVAGVIEPITEEYDVALHPCRGFASISFAGHIAATWAAIDKPIYAYYVGDFDASGWDIERDLREKLHEFSGGIDFEWKRLAICESDFDAFNLIELPVKELDSRARKFRKEHGDRCAELDALPPTELRRRVREAIESHISPWEWKQTRLQEQREIDSWHEVMGKLEATAG